MARPAFRKSSRTHQATWQRKPEPSMIPTSRSSHQTHQYSETHRDDSPIAIDYCSRIILLRPRSCPRILHRLPSASSGFHHGMPQAEADLQSDTLWHATMAYSKVSTSTTQDAERSSSVFGRHKNPVTTSSQAGCPDQLPIDNASNGSESSSSPAPPSSARTS